MKTLISKINHVIETALKNPFYQGKIHPITTLDEILEFPVVRKEDLLKLGVFDFLDENHAPLYEYHESSGSTNTPLTTWLSKNDFMGYVEQLNESPVKFNKDDIVLVRFPYALSVPAHTFTKLVHVNGGCVIHAGRGDNHCSFMKAVQLLVKTKATVFACNIQEAFILAEVAMAGGYNLKEDFNLRAICTAGEVFTNARKQRLEKLWRVPVYNFYGTTELGNLGVTDEDAMLYVSTNHFYFEVLNPLDKTPVKLGEKGVLYVTTLSKDCFPLIRYCTGDIVSVSTNEKKDEKHLLKLNHYGRDSEVYTYKNISVTFAEIQEKLLSLPDDIVGNMWKIELLENGIKIIAESDKPEEDTSQLKLNLEIPHEIQLVKKGTIFDVQKYMHEKMIGKPEYFIRKGEKND